MIWMRMSSQPQALRGESQGAVGRAVLRDIARLRAIAVLDHPCLSCSLLTSAQSCTEYALRSVVTD